MQITNKYKALWGLMLLALLCAVPLFSLGEGIVYPAEAPVFEPLGEPSDVYVVPGEKTPVNARKEPKNSGGVLYSWKQYALRLAKEQPADNWYHVYLPGQTMGYVPASQCALLEEEKYPFLATDLSTAGDGYIFVASKGEVPLLLVMQAGQKRQHMFLPNDGSWQPILLTLGVGRYSISIYESGVEDRLVRPLTTFAVSLREEIPDTTLALYSGVFANMEQNPVTVALAERLCRGLETDEERVAALWEWLVTQTKYDSAYAREIQFTKIPDPDGYIVGNKGICVDDAAFMAVALRSLGIPCKRVDGKNLRTGNQHAWNEVWLEGRWQIVDATMGRSRGAKTFTTEDAKHYERLTGLLDGFF